MLKALYSILVASLLWYKQFYSDLEGYEFKFNPYDLCVANKKVHGRQHTICFHVDDIMSSHKNTNSLTAALESVILTATVDAHKGCDVMIVDAPNTFVQTGVLEPQEGEDHIIIKITRVLVDYLVEIAPEIYGLYVVFQNSKRFYMYKC